MTRIYVVPELSTDNEQWINPDFGSPDLRTHYDNIRQMVKEKTGRAMQEKERERKGKNGNDNEQWINPDFGSPDLRTHYDNIRQMVKEKTGRAMQEKERERKGKNGNIIKIAGCSPIREGVLLVRSDTTLADVRTFGEVCQRRW